MPIDLLSYCSDILGIGKVAEETITGAPSKL
jgi:hypothetical protein